MFEGPSNSAFTHAQCRLYAQRRFIAQQPVNAKARAELGILLRDACQLSAARAAFLQALKLDERLAVAWLGLSLVATELGRGGEAAEALRRRYALERSGCAGSDWLYARLHAARPGEMERVVEEHREWGEKVDSDFKSQIADFKLQISDFRSEIVRVGYISGDFREHAQMRFIEPLLLGHDRSAFHIYCYSDVRRADAVTGRIRSYAHAWRETADLDDRELARTIAADRIDVLVELTGHMAGSRLACIAYRPARVQVAWPGYPFTTGMPAIDYLIGDDDREPPGAERFYTERLIRLPQSSQAVTFPEDAPEPGELPSERNGHITFGVSNRLGKVTPEMIQIWARVLSAARGSKLRIIVASTNDEDATAVRRLFAESGVAPHRLELFARATGPAYWSFYQDVDVCLDTFPYNGHTTTFDALWMAVPVVTLVGEHHRMSRKGFAILRALELGELAATTAEQYVSTAAALSRDIDRRRALRRELRHRLRASVFSDHAGLAGRMEAAYRGMMDGPTAAASTPPRLEASRS